MTVSTVRNPDDAHPIEYKITIQISTARLSARTNKNERMVHTVESVNIKNGEINKNVVKSITHHQFPSKWCGFNVYRSDITIYSAMLNTIVKFNIPTAFSLLSVAKELSLAPS